MNRVDQRIAIAEACGWSLKPNQIAKTPQGHEVWTYDNRGNSYGPYTIGAMLVTDAMKQIPDYLNDLNACADFEKTLTEEQAVLYRHLLASNSDGRKAAHRTPEAAMCHANAAQRCKAFLETLNLWKK